jgi:hypothetical protein
MLTLKDRLSALYDLEPLWKELALLRATEDELTPFLLPPDAGPVGSATATRIATIAAFAAQRRAEIAALELDHPGSTRGVREAWEIWWSDNRPNKSVRWDTAGARLVDHAGRDGEVSR